MDYTWCSYCNNGEVHKDNLLRVKLPNINELLICSDCFRNIIKEEQYKKLTKERNENHKKILKEKKLIDLTNEKNWKSL